MVGWWDAGIGLVAAAKPLATQTKPSPAAQHPLHTSVCAMQFVNQATLHFGFQNDQQQCEMTAIKSPH
jgi:hypothetical protein